jgi:hypothetical protein
LSHEVSFHRIGVARLSVVSREGSSVVETDQHLLALLDHPKAVMDGQIWGKMVAGAGVRSAANSELCVKVSLSKRGI